MSDMGNQIFEKMEKCRKETNIQMNRESEISNASAFAQLVGADVALGNTITRIGGPVSAGASVAAEIAGYATYNMARSSYVFGKCMAK